MSDFTISGLIEVSIDSLNEALSGVSDFANDISGQLDGLKDAANESIAIFQGFGALSLGGIAVFSEMDDQIKDLTASTSNLEDVSFDVAETFKSVYAEAGADGFEAVGDSIRLASKQLESISDTATVAAGDVELIAQAALQLEQSTGALGADEYIKSTTTLMETFGITSQEALDLMATASTGALGGSEDLADSIIEYSRHFDSVKLDAKEMFAVLESGADAFGTDLIGDAIKEYGIISRELGDEFLAARDSVVKEAFGADNDYLTNLVDKFNIDLSNVTVPSDLKEFAEYDGTTEFATRAIELADLKDEFLGVEAVHQILNEGLRQGAISDGDLFNELLGGLKEVESDFDRNAAAVALFGTKAEDLVGFEQALSTTSDSFKDVEGALKSVTVESISMQDSFDKIVRVATVSFASLGQQVSDAINLNGITDFVISVIETLGVAFENLSQPIKSAIGVFGALSIAIGTIAPFFGTITTSVAAFNPLVLAIVAAVAALAAGLAYLRDIIPNVDFSSVSASFDKAKEAVASLLGVLGDIGGVILSVVSNFFGLDEGTSSFRESVIALFQALADGVANGIAFFADFVNSAVSSLEQLAQYVRGLQFINVLMDALSSLSDIGSAVFGGFYSVVETFVSFLTGALSQVLNQFAGVGSALPSLTSVFKFVFETITSGLSFLSDTVNTVFNFISSVFNSLDFTSLSNSFGAVVDSVFSLVSGLISLGVDIAGVIIKVYEFATGLSQLGEGAGVFESLRLVISTAINSIIEVFASLLSFVSVTFSSIADVLNGTKTPLEALGSIFSAAFELIKTIVRESLETLTTLAFEILSNLPSLFATLLGLVVPAAQGALLALSELFTLAIEELPVIAGEVMATLGPIVSDALAQLPDLISSILSGLSSVVGDALGLLKGVFFDQFSDISGTASDSSNSIVDAITAALSNLPTVGLDALISFGQSLASGFSSVVSSLSELFRTVGTAIFDALGAAFGGVTSQVSTLLSPLIEAVGATFSSVVTAIQSALSPIISIVQTVLSGLVTLWNDILSPIVGIVTNILNGVLSVVSSILASLAGAAVSALSPLISGVTAVLAGLSLVFNSVLSPLASLVAGIVSSIVTSFVSGLGQLAQSVTQTLGAVRGVFVSVLSPIASLVSGVVSTIVSSFTSGLGSIITSATSVLGSLRASFKTSFDSILSVVSSVAGTIGTLFVNTVKTAFNAVSALLKGLESDWRVTLGKVASDVAASLRAILSSFTPSISDISGRVTSGLSAVLSSFTSSMASVSSAVTSGLNTVRQTFNDTLSNVISLVSSALSSIGSNFSQSISSYVSTVQAGMLNIKNDISSALTSILSNFVTSFSSILSAVQAGMLNVKNSISTTMTSVLSNIKTALSSILSEFTRQIGRLAGIASSAMSDMGAAIRNGFNSALSSINNLSSQFVQMGRDIIGGITAGVVAEAGRLAQAAVNAVQNALNSAAQALGIASPSKVSEDKLGVPIGQGVKVGVVEELEGLGDELGAVLNGAIEDVDIDTDKLNSTLELSQNQTLNSEVIRRQVVEVSVNISRDDALVDQISTLLSDYFDTDISIVGGLGLLA